VVYRCNSHANNICILQCQVSGIVVHNLGRRVAIVWFILACYLFVFLMRRFLFCLNSTIVILILYPQNSKIVFEIQN